MCKLNPSLSSLMKICRILDLQKIVGIQQHLYSDTNSIRLSQTQLLATCTHLPAGKVNLLPRSSCHLAVLCSSGQYPALSWPVPQCSQLDVLCCEAFAILHPVSTRPAATNNHSWTVKSAGCYQLLIVLHLAKPESKQHRPTGGQKTSQIWHWHSDLTFTSDDYEWECVEICSP